MHDQKNPLLPVQKEKSHMTSVLWCCFSKVCSCFLCSFPEIYETYCLLENKTMNSCNQEKALFMRSWSVLTLVSCHSFRLHDIPQEMMRRWVRHLMEVQSWITVECAFAIPCREGAMHSKEIGICEVTVRVLESNYLIPGCRWSCFEGLARRQCEVSHECSLSTESVQWSAGCFGGRRPSNIELVQENECCGERVWEELHREQLRIWLVSWFPYF